MRLGDYLGLPLDPWNPGTADCCTWVAAWIIASGHPDPMGFIRGTYEGDRGAALAIRRGGGMVALWSRGARDAELTRSDAPRAGDIAAISVPTDDAIGETCGIWTGERWAMRLPRGLAFGFGEPLIIWTGRWAV